MREMARRDCKERGEFIRRRLDPESRLSQFRAKSIEEKRFTAFLTELEQEEAQAYEEFLLKGNDEGKFRRKKNADLWDFVGWIDGLLLVAMVVVLTWFAFIRAKVSKK